VRNCTTLCLGALLVLVVVLVQDGLRWWSALPALIGTIALLAHWGAGPPLVLVSLAGLLLSHERIRMSYTYWSRPRTPTVMELILCAAVFTYVAGHYRLLSLTRHVFPPDPRRRGRSAGLSRRRAARLVTSGELTMVLLASLFWTGMAVLTWLRLAEDRPRLGLRPEVWRALLVVWALALAFAVVSVVIGYLRQARAAPEESLLYLQDQVWRETRREQGLVNRWLSWARLRGPGGEEGP
jgi:hypothetical protein